MVDGREEMLARRKVEIEVKWEFRSRDNAELRAGFDAAERGCELSPASDAVGTSYYLGMQLADMGSARLARGTKTSMPHRAREPTPIRLAGE